MRITVWLDDDEYIHTVEFIGDVKHEKIDKRQRNKNRGCTRTF